VKVGDGWDHDAKRARTLQDDGDRRVRDSSPGQWICIISVHTGKNSVGYEFGYKSVLMDIYTSTVSI
jgi:hypothetical protein